MSKKGRPLESPLPRDEMVSFRLNSKEMECLNSYCERYDVSIPDTIRDALMLLSVIPQNPLRTWKQ